jgi:hypothetical protein
LIIDMDLKRFQSASIYRKSTGLVGNLEAPESSEDEEADEEADEDEDEEEEEEDAEADGAAGGAEAGGAMPIS